MRDVTAEEFLPENAVVAIKEPYLHLDLTHPFAGSKSKSPKFQHMFCVVRVDHPSDLMVLSPSDALIPKPFRTADAVENPLQWKEKGNVAYSKRRFLEAQRCYTEGIRLSAAANHNAQPTLTSDLFRNRSRTCLELGFFGDAKSDALKALYLLASSDDRTKELNTKSLFRAATAAYSLDQFEESEELLVRLTEITPGDEAASALSKKIKLRFQERAHGTYNIERIRNRLQDSGSVDATSYLLKTEIRSTPDGGTGIFAVQDIRTWDIIFCEKAFVAAPLEDKSTKVADICAQTAYDEDRIKRRAIVSKYEVALWKNMVDKVTRNKSSLKSLAELEALEYAKPSVGELDDVFFLEDVANLRCTSMSHSAHSGILKTKGCWLHTHHLNQSCMPNTARAFIGDLIVLRATRDIKSNEQVFGNRNEFEDDFDGFHSLHKELFGKVCDCAICVAEMHTSPAQRAERTKILDLAAEFSSSVNTFGDHSSKAEVDKAIKTGFDLVKRLAATYDDRAFTGVMPRRGLGTLYQSLLSILEASPRYPGKMYSKDIFSKILLPALRATGCEVTVNAAGDVSFANSYGTDNPRNEHWLATCAVAAQSMCRFKTAKQFIALAKKMHLLEHCDNSRPHPAITFVESMLP